MLTELPWIPLTQASPQHEQLVFVFIEGYPLEESAGLATARITPMEMGEAPALDFEFSGFLRDIEDNDGTPFVTHWMPILAPTNQKGPADA